MEHRQAAPARACGGSGAGEQLLTLLCQAALRQQVAGHGSSSGQQIVGHGSSCTSLACQQQGHRCQGGVLGCNLPREGGSQPAQQRTPAASACSAGLPAACSTTMPATKVGQAAANAATIAASSLPPCAVVAMPPTVPTPVAMSVDSPMAAAGTREGGRKGSTAHQCCGVQRCRIPHAPPLLGCRYSSAGPAARPGALQPLERQRQASRRPRPPPPPPAPGCHTASAQRHGCFQQAGKDGGAAHLRWPHRSLQQPDLPSCAGGEGAAGKMRECCKRGWLICSTGWVDESAAALRGAHGRCTQQL